MAKPPPLDDTIVDEQPAHAGLHSEERARINLSIETAFSALALAETKGVSHGHVIMLWNGTTHILGPGQKDDGVSPRMYIGGPLDSSLAIPGRRSGDLEIALEA